MSAREITRRSLLASAGGLAAGALLRPARALGALGRAVAPGAAPKPVLFAHLLGNLPADRVLGAGGAAATIDLARNADLVGVRWSGAPDARVQLRARERHGPWSRWASAGAHGHGPDGPGRAGGAEELQQMPAGLLGASALRGSPPPGTIVGDPVWTGGATVVALRSNRPLRGVKLFCVDVSGGVGARALALTAGPSAHGAALELAAPTLPAGPGQPPIVARSVWARGMAKPRVAPEYGTVRMAFVHHTENPNGYSPGEVPGMLRAIYVFHRYVRGWNDIGYNFVVDLYGRIFEARAGGIDEPVIGAQAGGYNYVSTGVAVLGDFMSVPISAPAAGALQRLLAWKLSLHGIPTDGRVTVRVDPAGAVFSRYPAGARVSLPRIAGHRDADTTDCPGNSLYAELPRMRLRVHALAGRPARATLAISAPAPEPSGEPPEPRALTGSLTLLDRTPVAGAPIEIQAREVSRRGERVRERRIAQVQTAADGSWSLPVALTPSRRGMWLRALCPGASGGGAAGVPAAVSVPLRVDGVVSLTSAPAPAPAPTPEAAAPPSR